MALFLVFLFFLFGYAFENFDVSRMLVHKACIPPSFLVCTLTFINFLLFIRKQNQVS